MHEIGNQNSKYATFLSTEEGNSINKNILWRRPANKSLELAQEAERGSKYEMVVVYADNDHKLNEEDIQKVKRLTGVELKFDFEWL